MRLVYLSPIPWESFAQRPHKFIEWFHAKFQGEVLWVDPYPTRLPNKEDFRRHKTALVSSKSLSKKPPYWLQVIRPTALPIEPLPASGVINRFLWQGVVRKIEVFLNVRESYIGVGKPSEIALQILKRHPEVPSFYDAMDDFPAFYKGLSRQAMAQREWAIAERASTILVSSTALAARFEGYKSKVFKVLNACDAERIPGEKLILRNSEHPVFGYVGTIGDWFDWSLVIALANTNPMARIRLIGPVYSSPPEGMPSNIELLAACNHAAALRAMQNFSVGLIPFKKTELTASVDPIKYYEYRSLGLSVISTRFGEMSFREKQQGVFLVTDQSDFSSIITQALTYQSNKKEIEQFKNENSWRARFDACHIFN